MAWLSLNGVVFEARDVLENIEWLDELMDLGGRATPVTRIDGPNGSAVVLGFDRPKLEELLVRHT